MYIKYESKKVVEYIVNNIEMENRNHRNFRYRVLLCKPINGDIEGKALLNDCEILNVAYCDCDIDILELTRGYCVAKGKTIEPYLAIYRRRNTDKFYLVEKVGEIID